MKHFLIGCLAIMLMWVVSFFLTVGLFKIICWCFGFIFSWRLAVGFWIILAVLEVVFRKGD